METSNPSAGVFRSVLPYNVGFLNVSSVELAEALSAVMDTIDDDARIDDDASRPHHAWHGGLRQRLHALSDIIPDDELALRVKGFVEVSRLPMSLRYPYVYCEHL